MKGITLHEPWASLIAHGYKHHETRGWGTDYRGPIAIHAGLSALQYQRKFSEGINDDYPGVDPQFETGFFNTTRGRVVAVANLSDIFQVKNQEHRQLLLMTLPDFDLGDFSVGRHFWVLKDVVRLPNPVVTGGARGLWNVPPAIVDEINGQLAGITGT
jgi:hypothetical protein